MQIVLNLCTRSLVRCLQLFLDLSSTFSDKSGHLKSLCDCSKKITISSSPLVKNPDYDGSSDTALLECGQSLLPGNVKIIVTISEIPADWTINASTVSVTGMINCENVIVSAIIDGGC